MTTFSVQAPRLAGLVAAIPAHMETEADLALRFGEDAVRRIVQATGIKRRPVAPPDMTMADLAEAGARRLLGRLGWEPSSVGLLIVVTQTGDHPLPANACLLQHRLGLSTGAAAFDVNLGCSGYVYGLSIAASMLGAGVAERALLVAGDTTTHMISPDDRSVAPLFGDAVVVTALEHGSDGTRMVFDLGTDGAGAPYLTSATGGARTPGPPKLAMDGTQVMAFSLRTVHRTVASTLNAIGWPVSGVDAFVLHQANAMMLRTLGQKIGATPEQMVQAIEDCGNTSSASIPLAMVHKLQAAECTAFGKLVLCGFGVGWSWATCAWNVDCEPIADVVTVP